MSPNQTQLYWRQWAAATRAQGWGSLEAIAAARSARQAGVVWVSPELDAILANVWRIAEQPTSTSTSTSGLAGSVSANGLRHACHIVAIGRKVSSKRLSNADFDCVLALFRLLADPNRLANVIAWENRFELGERKRHVHFITQTPAAYWRAIALDKFGQANLDQMAVDELRQLSLTLRERSRAKATQAARDRGSVATDVVPS